LPLAGAESLTEALTCGFGGIRSAFAIPRSKRSSAPGSSFISVGGLSVMPQPLRKKVGLNLMFERIGEKPELAAKIGQIVAISGLMESRLSAILASVSGGNVEVTMAMFQAVNSTDAQRAMVKAAAEVALSGHELEALLELMDEYRNRARERNKIVHGIWATADEFPDALLLGRAADLAAMAKRITQLNGEWSSATEDLTEVIWRNCMVYEAKDFDDVISRLKGFDNQLANFWMSLIAGKATPSATPKPIEKPQKK